MVCYPYRGRFHFNKAIEILTTNIVKCKVVAIEHDILDYHILVFKNLENSPPFGHSYIMVTVFPNWQSRIPDLNEKGYLEYIEVTAGDDKWYDKMDGTFKPYNYNFIQFLKFITHKETDDSSKNIIL